MRFFKSILVEFHPRDFDASMDIQRNNLKTIQSILFHRISNILNIERVKFNLNNVLFTSKMSVRLDTVQVLQVKLGEVPNLLSLLP